MPQSKIDFSQQLPKLRGELAELAFMYRASSEGIAVAKPYGDSHPYDFLIQHGSRLLRIQVKSTYKNRTDRRKYGFQVIVARSHHKKGFSSYKLNEIDFIAAFAAPLEVWYLIPVERLGNRRTIFLYPDGKGMPFGGLYEDYREAWHLLKEDGHGQGKETQKQAEKQEHQNSSTSVPPS